MQQIKHITKKASKPIDLNNIKRVGYYPLPNPNKSNLPHIPVGMHRVVVEDGKVYYISEDAYHEFTGSCN